MHMAADEAFDCSFLVGEVHGFLLRRGNPVEQHPLLQSSKDHLHLPLVPAASAIGGHIQAINEVVVIRDEVVLSNHRAWRLRDDRDIPLVHCD